MPLQIFDITYPKLPFSIPLPGGLSTTDKLQISVNLQSESAIEITFKASDDETIDSRIPLNLSMTLDRIISKCGKNKIWEVVELSKPFSMNPGQFLLTITSDKNEYRFEVNGHLYSTFSHKYPPFASQFLEINACEGSAHVESLSFTKEIKWFNTRIGLPVPDTTFMCGKDEDNNDVYLGRGLKNNNLMIGSVNPAKNEATVAFDGREWPMHDFELLQDNSFFGWKMIGEDKEIPDNAVEGGFNDKGEVLYIGRVANERSVIPGALDKTNSMLSIAFKGKELKFSSRFEILTILSPKEVKNNRKAELLNLQLLNLDRFGVVPNPEPFECKICLIECPEGEGVVLRDCLHMFCKDCLSSSVKHCEVSEVKCPYQDEVYSCVMVLQEREIRTLVSSEVYQKHLAKSLREAENQMENTFHCMTKNCEGWCTYEDNNVVTFRCPICQVPNCLSCKTIHAGYTCKEYQDRLQRDREMQEKAKQEKQSKEHLEVLLSRGEAKLCPNPNCQAIITKISGCDHMMCSRCHTPFSWATGRQR